MRRETILAKIRVEVTFSAEMKQYLRRFEDQKDAWFARDGGAAFLAEFGGEWNKEFIELAQPIYETYFRELGLKEEVPNVTLIDSRAGSWIMEAAITMFGTIGTLYTVLKAYSELPKIAEGIEATNGQLKQELGNRYRTRVRERIEPYISDSSVTAVSQSSPSQPPLDPIEISCSIDARPIRALTPETPKSHSIHLSVSLTRSSVSIENLAETQIESLRLGLFKSTTQMQQWSYGDAFVKFIPNLSGQQCVALNTDEFTHQATMQKLDLSDDEPLFVDCWLQDANGIYLFNFHLSD